MDKIQVFQHIQTPWRKSLIYTRLGYTKTATQLEPERRRQMDQWITEAESLCDIIVIYKQLPLSHMDTHRVTLAGGIEFYSQALVRLLQYSTGAVLMATTAGRKITEAITHLQQGGNMVKALVYDAAASEITDAGLDWLTAFIRRPLMRQGQSLTHMRFSPGYGDLKLDCQQVFYKELELEKWGIAMTSKYMMLPEKTVTAVIGVEAPENTASKEEEWQ